MRYYFFAVVLLMVFSAKAQNTDVKNTRIDGEFKLPNVIAPLDYSDDEIYRTNASEYLPVKDVKFKEQVRKNLTPDEEKELKAQFDTRKKSLGSSKYTKLVSAAVNAVAEGDTVWIGTDDGLYFLDSKKKKPQKITKYGDEGGPLSNRITSLAYDSKGNLWIGTPAGLSLYRNNGKWFQIKGTDGLPVEDITALAVDKDDRIWIGTTQGAVMYTPYKEGRHWYYRAGKRYLIDDVISDIIISDDGMPVYFMTSKGVSKLDAVPMTLAQRAELIEANLEKWHRRNGLVAKCIFDRAEDPTTAFIPDDDNDGLWTAYHVVAMSLAYAVTGYERYKEAAMKSMHALYMLQNVSGIPGLVARSVVPVSMRAEKSAQWREAPNGKVLWKSDTSSDEIDGHFFAFYAYWEHVAKKDPEEAALLKKQLRTVIDYIVDNNYQLIDWDGERTRWGFWNPEELNDNPERYMESGLYSAQMLSFLKTSYYVTGDKKYKEHYDNLIVKHGYLGNLLLEKKVFPDANNHSDNQLAFCALYPLFQLEYDPRARDALQRTARRHYRVVSRDGSAFFYFAAATIDPDFVDIKGGVENLRQIPTDRRQWTMINSNRKDIIWDPNVSRFGKPQLLYVLPADERNFYKWNKNPYYPDGGAGGNVEDDGGSWLLAYWMGRYHGFITGEE